MKKIGLIFSILLCGVYFSGCSWISEAIERNDKEKEICEMFENIDLSFIKNNNTIKGYAYKTLDNVKFENIINRNFYDTTILDYDNGILDWFDSRAWAKRNKLNCPKLKILNTHSDTKSFAVNGSGVNDFNVKVTKEAHEAQKVKKGEIIEKDIKITSYTPEKVSIVEFEKYIYKPDSLYIKKMRNQYAREEKRFRNNLPCFEMNRKSYCDGDLVRVYGSDIMLRVVEAGYGTVNYKLYLYMNENPITVAGYEFMRQFEMSPPEVIGNHDLKKYEVPDERTLQLNDIKTFREW